MSGLKHTPGPWTMTRHFGRYELVNDDDIIAFVKPSLLPEDEANLKLIAAAPELLESLLKLVDSCDDSDGAQYGTLSTSFVRGIAAAALAKATGGPA